jgi:hypothetical protein
MAETDCFDLSKFSSPDHECIPKKRTCETRSMPSLRMTRTLSVGDYAIPGT